MKVLSSGSIGNCYILENDTEALVLDAGVKFSEVMKAVDYNILKIQGALVTHSHLDHAKYIKDFENNGIPVYKPYEHFEKMYKIGNFTVYPFDLVHNVPCYGFMIKHNEIGKMIYATDTCYVKYRFKNLNHMLIECNYSKDCVDRGAYKFQHEVQDHMEQETCLEFIRTNNSDSLRTCILCHLSQNSIEPLECIAEAKKINSRAKIDYARKGLTVDLDLKEKCPFE